MQRSESLRERERHHERRPFAGAVALRGDRAVMELDDVAGDGQAEAQAAALGGGVALAQAVEDEREKRRIDPLPLVFDADAHLVIDAVEMEVDLFAGGGELDGI